jgi:hypothetical protein
MLGPLEEKKHVNNPHSLEELQENIWHEISTIPNSSFALFRNIFSRWAASLQPESSVRFFYNITLTAVKKLAVSYRIPWQVYARNVACQMREPV